MMAEKFWGVPCPNLAGRNFSISAMWSQVTPLAELIKMVQYYGGNQDLQKEHKNKNIIWNRSRKPLLCLVTLLEAAQESVTTSSYEIKPLMKNELREPQVTPTTDGRIF